MDQKPLTPKRPSANILSKILIILLLCLPCVGVIAQDVKVISFKDLDALFNKKTDTTYVVNFWATWCVPCVRELPDILEVNRQLKEQKVSVLLVSMDFEDDLSTRVIPFLAKHDIDVPVYLMSDTNYNEWMPRIDKSWTGAIPATVIYRMDKRNFYEKSFTKDELIKAINQLNI